MKQTSFWKQWLAGMAIVLLCVLGTELVYANRDVVFGAPASTQLLWKDAKFDSEQLQKTKGETLLLKSPGNTAYSGQTAVISFDVPQLADVREISIECRAPDDDGALTFVRFDTRDDARRYAWQWIDTASFANTGRSEVRVKVSAYGALHGLKLSFTTTSAAAVELVSVTLNPAPVFTFRWTRALLWLCVAGGALALWLLIRKRAVHTIVYDAGNKRHRAAVHAATALCALLALFLALCVMQPNFKTVEEIAGQGTVDGNTAYARHFSALLHGQAHLELPVDPDFATLHNVYDASERIAKNVDYYSDYAYADGKYYSYFGVAPLVFVHFPVYLLTGTIASDALVNLIFGVLTVLLLCGALEQILRAFAIRTGLLLRVAAIPALCFGTTLYMQIQGPSMYNNAAMCAVACFAGFVYCAFLAYHTKRPWLRRLLFFAAGVAAFGIAGSRPIVAVMALCWALPLFLHIVYKRERSLRSRLGDASSFLVPAIIGCAGLLVYNAVRFGSPFDFGMALQLTNHDVHAYKLSLSPAALWQTFSVWFTGTNLRYTANYPFVRFDYLMQPLLGRFVCENIPALSVFSMPLCWGWLAAPGVWRSSGHRQAVQKWTWRLVTAGVLVSAWMEFMFGGMDVRYLFDFMPGLCLLAVLVLLQRARAEQEKGSHAVQWVALGLCALTVCTGSALLFSGSASTPALYQALKQMFTLPW